MVNMTYQDLFFTTKKGLPNITALPSTITMSSNVFVYSLILQIIVFIFLIFHFGWAIYRVIKKMKNNRFQDVPNQDERREQQAKNNYEKDPNEQDNNQKDDDLVYKFDEEDEDEEEEEDKQKKGDKDEDDEQQAKQDYDSYHDEKQQVYIETDHRLMFLTPFTVGFIICNNLFSADYITILSLVAMIITFYVFNIKQQCDSIKITKGFFIVFALFGYASFFLHDHSIS